MMKIQDLSMMETLNTDRSPHGAIVHIQGGEGLFEMIDLEMGFLDMGFLDMGDMMPVMEMMPSFSSFSARSSLVEGNSSSTASSFSIDS